MARAWGGRRGAAGRAMPLALHLTQLAVVVRLLLEQLAILAVRHLALLRGVAGQLDRAARLGRDLGPVAALPQQRIDRLRLVPACDGRGEREREKEECYSQTQVEVGLVFVRPCLPCSVATWGR